jgi:hypothetical protein
MLEAEICLNRFSAPLLPNTQIPFGCHPRNVLRLPALITRRRCTNSAIGRRTPTGWTVIFATHSVRKPTLGRSFAQKLRA